MPAREFNFDGLVGPTHNYAGLSYGNVASAKHRQLTAHPRAAALEGLNKMRRLWELGLEQAILPPQPRPHLSLLRSLGFRGSPAAMIEAAYRAQPSLVAACYSASSMWTANAATVSPGPDCGDGRLHITPANLSSMLHRAIEAPQTYRLLRHLFAAVRDCSVHEPLAAWPALADEGAANHTRLCREYDGPGVELFVFGRSVFDHSRPAPGRFPARQTLESCQAIGRNHLLRETQMVFIQQHPHAIDAGVFHNDVVCVGNQSLLLVHEMAFVDQDAILADVAARFAAVCNDELQVLQISERELPLADAVASYLFNSQLVTRPNGRMCLICPSECQEIETARRVVEQLVAGSNPIEQVEFVNLRQSMNNGGGPACLRLRVVLTDEQAQALAPGVRFSSDVHDRLSAWVQRHYRETLAPDDLRDPQLMGESQAALAELAEVLGLPNHLLEADEPI